MDRIDNFAISLPGHISSREDLNENEKKVLAVVWDRYNTTVAKSTGLVFASGKLVSGETGIEPNEVKAISRKLDSDGFWTYVPGKSTLYGDKPMAASYTLNMDAWKRKVEEVELTPEFMEEVCEPLLKDSDHKAKPDTKAWLQWGENFTDKGKQEFAVKYMFLSVLSRDWNMDETTRKLNTDKTFHSLKAVNDCIWGSRDIYHLMLERQGFNKTAIDKSEAMRRKEAQHGEN